MNDLALNLTLKADGSGLTGTLRASKAEVERFRKGLDNTKRSANSAAVGLDRAEKKTKQLGTSAEGTLGKLRSMRGALAALGVGALLKDILDTNREFESLRTSLITVTGSAELAGKAFDGIKAFAAETPFSVQEVTRAFTKLTALGLEPSERALRSYGNTAGAMGESLNDMIEAVADASTGEFERLKEFGIKARSQGEQVTFVFRGVSTTVAKEASAIEGYLRRIGEVDFASGMELQARTLDGAISNLGDAWANLQDQLLDDKASSDVSKRIRLLGDLLNWVADTAVPNFQASFATGLALVKDAFVGLRSTAEIVWEAIKAAGQGAINVIKSSFADLLDYLAAGAGKLGLQGTAAALSAAAGNVRPTGSAFDELKKTTDAILAAAKAETEANAKELKATMAAIVADKNRSASLNDVAEQLKDAATAGNDNAGAMHRGSVAAAAQASAFSNVLRQLEDEHARLTLATRAYYDHTLAAQGLTAAERQMALALYDRNRVLELANSLESERTRELKAYQEQVEILNRAEAQKLSAVADYHTLRERLEERHQQRLADIAQQEFEASATGLQKLSAEYSDVYRQLDDASVRWAEGFTDSLVQAARTGKLTFRDLADAIIEDLIRIATQALIVKPIIDAITGGDSGSGGLIGTLAGAIGLPGFATGGEFTVGGAGGTDSQVVAFRATPGETVSIRTPAQQSMTAAPVMHFSVTNNIDARGATPGMEARIQQVAQRASQEAVDHFKYEINRGGPTARLVGRRR